MCTARIGDAERPRRAVIRARRIHISAGLEQEVAKPFAVQHRDGEIQRIAFANAAEVHARAWA